MTRPNNTEDVLRWFETEIPSGCMLFTGPLTNEHKYGRVGVRGKFYQAHRLFYEHHIGPIPVGFELDHLCRNPRCVNPSHLEPVTHQENVRRGVSIVAINARKTHCKNGHPFEGDNLRFAPNGQRKCATCNRHMSAKAWRKQYAKRLALRSLVDGKGEGKENER